MPTGPVPVAPGVRPYPLTMDPRPGRGPTDDGAAGPGADPDPAPPAKTVLARLAVPVRHGSWSLSLIDTVAIGVSMWALVFMNQWTTPDHLPLLVASLAASAVVLFSLPGLDIARSWNVIAGQFIGASAAFASVSLFGGHPAVAAGCAVALAFVLMRLVHALHPPGASTAMIIALVPADHGVRFLFFPVLAGAITITVFAWLVHLAERPLRRRVDPDPGAAAG